MTQEQKSYAVRKIREYASSVIPGIIVFVVMVTLAVTLPFVRNGVLSIIQAILVGLIVGIIARIHRIIFVIKMRRNASYIESHNMECYVVPIYKMGNSITNYLEKWTTREPNLAYFRYGESYKMYVHKLLSIPNNKKLAIVFVDEGAKKVIGIPGAYLPDIEDAFKDRNYYSVHKNIMGVQTNVSQEAKFNTDTKTNSILSNESQEIKFQWGEEEVVEPIETKKNRKPIIIVLGIVLLVIVIGVIIAMMTSYKSSIFENTFGKSKEDVIILEKIVLAQSEANGGKLPVHIDYDLDSSQYLWEYGRLVGIYWEGMHLQAPIDISGLSQLREITLENNRITDITFGDNENLSVIDISNNPLGNLTVGDGCPNLKILICQYCELDEGLSVSDLQYLEELYCSYSDLDELYLKDNSCLTILNCEENNITYLDISSNEQLSKIDCSGNELESIDVSYNKKLIMFDCSENKIKELNLSANAELLELDCSYNKITELDVSNNAKLTEINVNHNHQVSVIWATE